MSIVPMILEHEAPGGRLRRFTPIFRGSESELRKLSIESGVYEWMHQTSEAEDVLEMLSQARAHCGVYVRGSEIDDRDFMKRVQDRRRSPPSFGAGVWALRVRFNPQHRLFGFFALPDWLVVLRKQERGVLEEGAHRWHSEIDSCMQIWQELFPEKEPWVRETLGEYLLFNAEKCDGRW